MKVKETAKKPYGICPASMTIWNADQTYNTSAPMPCGTICSTWALCC